MYIRSTDKPHWFIKLPLVRHVRYWYLRNKLQKHIERSVKYGFFPIASQQDIDYLDQVWKGRA